MEHAIGNPFESTQPAREYFVGRQREVHELGAYFDTVRSGGATNLYIVGGGGDGKTSFLFKAMDVAIGKGLIASVITLTNDMDSDLVISQLIESILDALADGNQNSAYKDDFNKGMQSTMFRIPGNLEKNKPITIKDVQHDLELLLTSCEALGIGGIVFCIDEGQQFLQIGGGAWLAKLRGAIQGIGKGYMIILAALEDILPTIGHNFTGVDRFFPNVIRLGAFENENVAVAAIDKRLTDKPVKLSTDIKTLIARISELHPKLIVDICHDVYASAMASNVSHPNPEMIRDAIFRRYNQELKTVLSIMGELTPSHRSTLRKAILARKKVTAKEIALLYCNDGQEDCVNRVLPTVNNDLILLVEKGLFVRAIEDGQEVFRVISSIVQYLLECQIGGN